MIALLYQQCPVSYISIMHESYCTVCWRMIDITSIVTRALIVAPGFAVGVRAVGVPGFADVR